MVRAMADRFDICLPFTLAQECPLPRDWNNSRNFSNDAHDPGGETMCGITQREYDAWRKVRGELTRDVRELTQDEGDAIYRQSYWMTRCPMLPAGLDLAHFDASVNEGCTEATRIMQHTLGNLAVDGLWGPRTQARVAGIQAGDVLSVIHAHTARRKAVYQMMPGFKYFGRGWLRRADEIGAQALKMAAAAKPQESTMSTTAQAPAVPAAPGIAVQVDRVLHDINQVLPYVVGGVSLFVPGASPFTTVLLKAFQAVVSAADIVAADTGKPFPDVLQDVINHLDPNKPNVPSLTPQFVQS